MTNTRTLDTLAPLTFASARQIAWATERRSRILTAILDDLRALEARGIALSPDTDAVLDALWSCQDADYWGLVDWDDDPRYRPHAIRAIFEEVRSGRPLSRRCDGPDRDPESSIGYAYDSMYESLA